MDVAVEMYVGVVVDGGSGGGARWMWTEAALLSVEGWMRRCGWRWRCLRLLTRWDSRGDGGGGQLALALGGHAGHLDGVGGQGGEARDPVLQCDVGEVVGDPSVGAVELLPGDTVT